MGRRDNPPNPACIMGRRFSRASRRDGRPFRVVTDRVRQGDVCQRLLIQRFIASPIPEGRAHAVRLIQTAGIPWRTLTHKMTIFPSSRTPGLREITLPIAGIVRVLSGNSLLSLPAPIFRSAGNKNLITPTACVASRGKAPSHTPPYLLRRRNLPR